MSLPPLTVLKVLELLEDIFIISADSTHHYVTVTWEEREREVIKSISIPTIGRERNVT